MEEQKKQEITPWPWYAFSHDYSDCLDEWNTEFGVSSAVNKRGLSLMCGADSEEEMMANATVMAAAPELRAALEDLVRRQCELCKAEMHVACEKNMLPCQISETCGRGLDDARKAIEKSYWTKENSNG